MLPCLDSEQMAASRREELNIAKGVAAALGQSAVQAALEGFYFTKGGQRVVWRGASLLRCHRRRLGSVTLGSPVKV
jgi:hypothetical protein